ncbi:hypothetical protein ACFUIY_10265 [Streptomyces griseorubiginosus]|uniref:hypothetical protein n=1 Tax=Streptomyces griseorubiginosus TaxID=67304 RepID=UPI0036369D59
MLGNGQTLRPLYGSRLYGPHVCLPNPHHRRRSALEAARQELALPHDELTTHWAPRSRGVARIDEPGWLFTGRRALMRRLIASATGKPCAVIVSGGAGSGKSAALARLVTLSDQRFLEKYAHEVEQVPADLRPPPGAVLATGKMHSRVMSQICSALRVPVPTGAGEPTVDDQLAAWHAWLKDRGPPITIVVDTLDEAADPQTLNPRASRLPGAGSCNATPAPARRRSVPGGN